MRLVKQEGAFNLDLFLEDKDKYLGITYGGNCDLYWSIHSKDVRIDNSFIITKENYGVYELFENLYIDIENLKNKYGNYSQNELYDGNNTITWYSDETAYEVANILKIIKEENQFKVEFYTQPHIRGYDEDFHTYHYIPIRFRTDGSRYQPFHIAFMKMYKDIKNLDDVNDIGHQIHIEEYLYNKVKILNRR